MHCHIIHVDWHAQKWHPDKHKCNDAATTKFQEINEAYSVLSDPEKRLDYDLNGNYEINNYTLPEYLARFKGMILTCNGLGMSQDSVWSEQLTEYNKLTDKWKLVVIFFLVFTLIVFPMVPCLPLPDVYGSNLLLSMRFMS